MPNSTYDNSSQIAAQGATDVNNFVGSYMPNIAGTPTQYSTINPLSQYVNQGNIWGNAISDVAPYYQTLLNNFMQGQSISSQKYLNEYNNSTNQLNATQQNYLNYHNAANRYTQAQIRGQNQGYGMGSSSMNTEAGAEQAKQYRYDLNNQAIGNNYGLQSAQNTYNYNTAMNANQSVSQKLNLQNQEASAAVNNYSNANNQQNSNYNNLLNSYYNNYNMANVSGQGFSANSTGSNNPTNTNLSSGNTMSGPSTTNYATMLGANPSSVSAYNQSANSMLGGTA